MLLRYFYLVQPEVDKGIAGHIWHGENMTYEECDGGMQWLGIVPVNLPEWQDQLLKEAPYRLQSEMRW